MEINANRPARPATVPAANCPACAAGRGHDLTPACSRWPLRATADRIAAVAARTAGTADAAVSAGTPRGFTGA
jgi:hypothetical protein